MENESEYSVSGAIELPQDIKYYCENSMPVEKDWYNPLCQILLARGSMRSNLSWEKWYWYIVAGGVTSFIIAMLVLGIYGPGYSRSVMLALVGLNILIFAIRYSYLLFDDANWFMEQTENRNLESVLASPMRDSEISDAIVMSLIGRIWHAGIESFLISLGLYIGASAGILYGIYTKSIPSFGIAFGLVEVVVLSVGIYMSNYVIFLGGAGAYVVTVCYGSKWGYLRTIPLVLWAVTLSLLGLNVVIVEPYTSSTIGWPEAHTYANAGTGLLIFYFFFAIHGLSILSGGGGQFFASLRRPGKYEPMNQTARQMAIKEEKIRQAEQRKKKQAD